MNFEGQRSNAGRTESGAGVQAGQYFEKSVFKVCPGNDDTQEYSTFRESVDWVKKHQPEKDLRNPETLDCEQLKTLKNKILEKLPNVDQVLKFYTAIGSKLDILHGVDGFFELGDKVVTVDLTLNPEKRTAKADVIILADDEFGITEEVAERAADNIVRKFALDSLENIRSEKIPNQSSIPDSNYKLD